MNISDDFELSIQQIDSLIVNKKKIQEWAYEFANQLWENAVFKEFSSENKLDMMGDITPIYQSIFKPFIYECSGKEYSTMEYVYAFSRVLELAEVLLTDIVCKNCLDKNNKIHLKAHHSDDGTTILFITSE